MYTHMYILGGGQNYGPFLGTLNIRCRLLSRTQKGAIILTTTHIEIERSMVCVCVCVCLKDEMNPKRV